MSLQAMVWVMNHSPEDLNGTEQSVAIALANYATDEGGHCWPSVEKLARITRWNERTVQRALRSLVDKGVIEIEKKATQHKPAVYCFPVFRGDSVPPLVVSARGDSVSPRGDSVSPRGDSVPPEPIRTNKEPITTQPAAETAPENSGDETTAPKSKRKGGRTLEKTNPYWHDLGRWNLFEEYWAKFPHKTAKEDAKRAWREVLGMDVYDNAVMEAFYKRFHRDLEKKWKGREERFIPHLGTWINRRDWEQDIKQPASTS